MEVQREIGSSLVTSRTDLAQLADHVGLTLIRERIDESVHGFLFITEQGQYAVLNAAASPIVRRYTLIAIINRFLLQRECQNQQRLFVVTDRVLFGLRNDELVT